MFHLNILLVITIASKTCLGRLPKLEDWEDYFLRGECDKFNDAVAKLNDWKEKRISILNLIQNYYTGETYTAEKISNCISKMTIGSTFDLYETKVRAYLALNRMLNHEMTMDSQYPSFVRFEMAISMSKINSEVNTSLQQFDRDVIKQYMDFYKEELLPSIKSICFDEWPRIKNPYDKTHLENSSNWYLTERWFRINRYGVPVIDVILTNHNQMLVSDENGDVSTTSKDSPRSGYHWWVAEFAEENMEDAKFRFKNKQTDKYLNTDLFQTVGFDDISMASMTMDERHDINFNIQSDFDIRA